jgi:hypothetical protein
MSSPLIPIKLLGSQPTEELCWNTFTPRFASRGSEKNAVISGRAERLELPTRASWTLEFLNKYKFYNIWHYFLRNQRTATKKINPSVKFQSESNSYDVNNQMDNFIASGANLIFLNAGDSREIAPVVMRVEAAGVTMVAVWLRKAEWTCRLHPTTNKPAN